MGDHQNNHDAAEHDECAAREGVIVAGVKWLADLSPETWTALATIAIAAFTGTLWWATLVQGKLTRESLDLARQEFLSTHRPLLIVRRIVPRLIENHWPRVVEFTLVNTGTTPGHVLGGIARLQILPDHLPEPRYGNEDPVFHPRVFEPGQEDTYTAVARHPRDAAVPAGHSVHFVGYVAYRDGRGTFRTTYFCRRYSPEGRRFDVTGDPDWESND